MNYPADTARYPSYPALPTGEHADVFDPSHVPRLVSRTQKQHRTQQVSKVTKVVREVRHVLLPDEQTSDYSNCFGYIPPNHEFGSSPEGRVPSASAAYDDATANAVSPEEGRRNSSLPGCGSDDALLYLPCSYPAQEFERFPGRGISRPPPQQPSFPFGHYSAAEHYHGPVDAAAAALDRPPTPPTSSDKSISPAPQPLAQENPYANTRKGMSFPVSGYSELDSTLIPPHELHHEIENCELDGERYVRYRDPDLKEVIEFLKHSNSVVQANAAAYLQHLCYMDNLMKSKTKALGGIPPLVALLNSEIPEVHRNACGALRNLSYGRENDENKKEISKSGGIAALVRLLKKSADNEVRELVTGILWNLSSCEELKTVILDESHAALINYVIIPHSGWDKTQATLDHHHDVYWSTVFRNASGVLRNISSAGEYARKKLRETPGLVDSLLFLVRSAFGNSNIDNKSVENCVCILRNLSYRCQEVEDPHYDRYPPSSQSRSSPQGKENDLSGCFGSGRKKKDLHQHAQKEDLHNRMFALGARAEPVSGMELLWQPEVVQPYLTLLTDCSNPETLEAAAGAIQNLAACYWQPSADIRAAVRKEKGLPILVELLRMDVDKVVCAVATALRNLAIDQRNKELIGKYAMRDLVNRLPSGSAPHDQGTSDQTVCAVLATLNEVIRKNPEFSRSLYEAGGVDRLVSISWQRGRYSTKEVRFASQVLQTMWQHQELRDTYRRGGWKEQDFVCKSLLGTSAARSSSTPRPGSPSAAATANNTLNRPMSSQGGTRYEDRTFQRARHPANDLQMADMSYQDGVSTGNSRVYSQRPLSGPYPSHC